MLMKVFTRRAAKLALLFEVAELAGWCGFLRSDGFQREGFLREN